MTDAPIVSTIAEPRSDRSAMVVMCLIFGLALIGAITTLTLV